MIFRYGEKSLLEVSSQVLTSCFKALKDFPTMFEHDHMINFSTPNNIGFGLSRGPSCCLFSGDTILDYSGQLLNLASRLTDLARPRGIVLSSNYGFDIIPKELGQQFKTSKVYLRGVAEEIPVEVLYSTHVTIPEYAFTPVTMHNWVQVDREIDLGTLQKIIDSRFTLNIPSALLSTNLTKLEYACPSLAVEGYTTSIQSTQFSYFDDAKGHHIRGSYRDIMDKMASFVGADPQTKITITFQYVPKPELTAVSQRKPKT